MRCASFISLFACWPLVAGAAESPSIDYRSQIAPILKTYCTSCHNPDDHEGELSLERYDQLMAGGKHGAVVAAGRPAESRLLLMLTGKAEPAMPPKDNERPTAKEIATLEAWVAAGARGPDGAEPDPTLLVTPKIPMRGAPVRPVVAVACSPDGQRWAVARSNSVVILRASDRSIERTLEVHRGRVGALAFSADGSLLATGAGEPGLVGEARLWRVADGQLIRTFRGHKDNLYAVQLSPDGTILATAGYDQEIKLWNAATGEELRTLAGHNDAVFDLAFRKGGQVLASASGDRTVKLWDVASGERLDTFSQPLKDVYSVALSPHGTHVAAGGADNRIRLWQLSPDAKENTNPILVSRFAHEGAVLKLAYSPDGRTLVSSADDRTVRIWEADTLNPRAELARQSDWTAALAVTHDSSRLLVGRLDGSLAVYNLATGQPDGAPIGLGRLHARPARGLALVPLSRAAAAMALALAADAPPAKPELSALSHRGITRGKATTIRATGKNFAAGIEAKSSHASLAVKLVAPPTKPEEVEIEVSPDAALAAGRYEIWLASPAGETAHLPLWVDDLPQEQEREPNDKRGEATAVSLGSGAWGVLAAQGDVDCFRFEAKAGQTVVLEASAATFGSPANLRLTLFDAAGRVVAGNNEFDDGPDPALAYTPAADGAYTVEISDQSLAGSGGHFYRLTLGTFAFAAAAYPPDVSPEASAEVEVLGLNVPPATKSKLQAPKSGEADVPLDTARFRSRRPIRVRVADGSSATEQEPNDAPERAAALVVPGAVQGRIWPQDGSRPDADIYKFESRAGERWIVETEAARRGSPLDSTIEILHADGSPVERVWLQAMRDSYITFRSIDAGQRDVRLVNWEEMQLNEFVYFGGEVCKLFRAPQGPDSGFVLYEGEGGKRRSYFDTSATTHPLDEPSYIVTPHPPGTELPANGLPVFRMHYANDDDGDRALGSDSRLSFTAPADGAYLVRVRDARGFGGDRFTYRLTVRPAKPDFRVVLHGAGATIGTGSGKAFTVAVERIDGFDGDVRVDIGGALPPGFSATSSLVIEAGHRSAQGVLVAAADAPAPTDENASLSKVTATAAVEGKTVTKDVNNLGRIALSAKPKLVVQLLPLDGKSSIEIVPGTRTKALLKVERAGFDGIVNLEVNNLPHGVIVDDIGLNAVQILEGQTERQVFFHCASWVAGCTRPIHAVAKAEGDQASPPVEFRVLSAPTAAASAGK